MIMAFLIAEQTYGVGRIVTGVRGAMLVTIDNWERIDILPFEPEEDPVGSPAVVVANHGRWIVNCPNTECGGAQFPSGKDHWFFCTSCLNVNSNYKLVPLVWPTDPSPAQLVEVLVNRKQEKNRNWYPGETIAMLIDQNVTHVNETHDVPAFIRDRMQFGFPMDWTIPKDEQVTILKRAGLEIPVDLKSFDPTPTDGYVPDKDYNTGVTLESLKRSPDAPPKPRPPIQRNDLFSKWVDVPTSEQPDYVQEAFRIKAEMIALGEDPTDDLLFRLAMEFLHGVVDTRPIVGP